MALTEKSVYLWTGLLLALLAITFNKDLALIYLSIIALDFILFQLYKNKITLNTVSGNSGRAVMFAIVAYIIFMVAAIITMTLLQYGAVQKSPTEAFFRAQWQSGVNPTNPLFQDNPIVILLSYGFLIPILETRLTGRFYNILTQAYNVDTSSVRLKNYKHWAAMIFISGFAVLFHIQAKGVTDNVALLLTGIFWIAQMILMSKTNEMESAIDLHIINNTVTVLKNVLHAF